MYTDALLLVSDAQDIGQTEAAYLSTYSIDTWAGAVSTLEYIPGTTERAVVDIGKGEPVEMLCQIIEAVVGTSSTIKFELVMADDAALTSNLVVLADSGLIAEATLVAGYRCRLAVPRGGITKRYLGMRYTVGTATTTAGTVTAGIVRDQNTAQWV